VSATIVFFRLQLRVDIDRCLTQIIKRLTANPPWPLPCVGVGFAPDTMDDPESFKALRSREINGRLKFVQRLGPCLTRVRDVYLKKIITQSDRQRLVAFGARQRVQRKVYSAVDVRAHNASAPRLK